VHATRPELKIVLVLNKIDLVPPHVTAAWVRHLKADYPVVLFKASTRVHNGKVLAHARTRPDTATDKQLSTGDCVGAEQLLQVLKAMSRTDAGFGGKAKISVGVVGQPNVGKSSLINSLLRHKAACTGDRPGVTKHLQALQLDKGITLLDSPGVVVESGADAVTSEAVLALRNCGTQFTCFTSTKVQTLTHMRSCAMACQCRSTKSETSSLQSTWSLSAATRACLWSYTGLRSSETLRTCCGVWRRRGASCFGYSFDLLY
jgi:hypothetical protein